MDIAIKEVPKITSLMQVKKVVQEKGNDKLPRPELKTELPIPNKLPAVKSVKNAASGLVMLEQLGSANLSNLKYSDNSVKFDMQKLPKEYTQKEIQPIEQRALPINDFSYSIGAEPVKKLETIKLENIKVDTRESEIIKFEQKEDFSSEYKMFNQVSGDYINKLVHM